MSHLGFLELKNLYKRDNHAIYRDFATFNFRDEILYI